MMLADRLEAEQLPFFLRFADDWIAEEKLDGDRIRLELKDGQVKLWSRGKSGNVIERYPELHDFNGQFTDGQDVLLDGEMCVLDENGLSQFNEGISFRTHLKDPEKIDQAMIDHPVTYMVFDIVEIEGENLRDLPWYERRKILEGLFIDKHPHIQVVDYSDDILHLWETICKKGGEGIMLKKFDGIYLEGKRSSNWKKVKNIKETDLVFTKYTVNPKGIRIETEEGIACQCSGYHAPEVKRVIDEEGKATVTIRHLGETKRGKFRQPTFMKLTITE